MSSEEVKDSEYILEVKNLKKYFDVDNPLFGKSKQQLKAVDDLNFRVKENEVFGIVGESGSGKSTLANVIMRLLEPTSGSINFNGENIEELSEGEMRKKRMELQMIFQDPYSSLNPRMKVFDIIAEPLRTHNIAKGKELEKIVYNLLEEVGLNESHANRYPHEFSGGQRQRIGIARALALKPKLVICDEPVSALDVSVQAQILNLLKRLQREYGLTYIFIAHGLPSVKHVSDRIAVMYLGKIVELTTKEKLFEEPKHPYTEGLLQAVPIPDPKVREEERTFTLEGDMPSAINPPKGCYFHTRCPYAQKKCKAVEPQLEEIAPDHYVACHFPLEAKDFLKKENENKES